MSPSPGFPADLRPRALVARRSIPPCSPYNLARVWRALFVPNAITHPSNVATMADDLRLPGFTVQARPCRSGHGCSFWPPNGGITERGNAIEPEAPTPPQCSSNVFRSVAMLI